MSQYPNSRAEVLRCGSWTNSSCSSTAWELARNKFSCWTPGQLNQKLWDGAQQPQCRLASRKFWYAILAGNGILLKCLVFLGESQGVWTGWHLPALPEISKTNLGFSQSYCMDHKKTNAQDWIGYPGLLIIQNKKLLIVTGPAKWWVLPRLGDRPGYVGNDSKTCFVYNLSLDVVAIGRQVEEFFPELVIVSEEEMVVCWELWKYFKSV